MAAGAAGALLPPDLLAGEPSRLLVTFLGLVSASILPAVSLVIGSLSSAGRSVSKIDELAGKLVGAVRSLFAILGLIGAVVLLLLLIAVLPGLASSGPRTAFWNPDPVIRGLQSLAFLVAAAAALRALAIPAILLEVLETRRDMAIHEARKTLAEAAPSEAEVRQMFATREGFGAIVPRDTARR